MRVSSKGPLREDLWVEFEASISQRSNIALIGNKIFGKESLDIFGILK